jgi:hypothetical protein
MQLPGPAIATLLHAQGCKKSVRELRHNCKWKTPRRAKMKSVPGAVEISPFCKGIAENHMEIRLLRQWLCKGALLS